jgi:hypothetical protein
MFVCLYMAVFDVPEAGEPSIASVFAVASRPTGENR